MTNFRNSYRKYIFSLEQINQAAAASPSEFIQNIERTFKHEINHIVDHILNTKKCKVVMISGPSSSGKTTVAHLIKNILSQKGKDAIIVSLDNFFLGKDKVPIDENGEKNYDSIDSIDINEIKRCIKDLIESGQCDIPTYDFAKMEPGPERIHLKLTENSIVIIEGIHALNPILTPKIDPGHLLKVYADVKQGINDYNGEVLSANDIRFIRRMIRDCKYRGTSVDRTVEMWNNVCKNADIYITPFNKISDFTLNTFHVYEPCIFSVLALPLIKTVNKDSKNYEYSKKIFVALDRFYPISSDYVPQDSLLQEFI